MDKPAQRSEKARANLLRSLFLFEKYERNIDDVGERGGIVGTYSSGVKMTLKVRITPMEPTILQ